MATTTPRLFPAAAEWQLTRHNLNEIDDQLDRDHIFTKGHWENVDGRLAVTGLRIGSDYADRCVAKFGDFITRHPDGTYTVRTATAAEKAAYRLKDSLLAEQQHQYRDLDTDSACRPRGFTCPACPPDGGAS
ncbi:hypothetical protein ACH4FX_38950 [Streptomyces sp. NPDC018019]|uniref:hypothetical protein n=1 Tax=Streptomyces sp. NPDC018019 TaxID=3365030 RepID=UPI0037882C85